MTVFPVTTSTLSAKELGEFIKDKYQLNENFICELFRTGMNHTYFLSDKETKYVLRVYSHNWRSKSEIIEEIELLKLLKENNIPISFPISDKNGDFIQGLNAPEGIRYAVLFSFATGEKVRFINRKTCFLIGSTMARIHDITLNRKIERINYDANTLVKQPYEYAKQFFPETLEEMKYIKNQCEKISKCFDEVDITKIKSGIVHMDIWYDNMNITDQDEITIFDFDFCGNGWFILDIAYFCKQLFHIESDKEKYERKIQIFLEGYQSIRKLSIVELNIIPEVGVGSWIFYLGIQSQRFDWSNIFLTENYLKMYIGKMKLWIDYYKTKEITVAKIS